MSQDAYFNYSKKERTGILVLISILLVTAIVPKFFRPDLIRTIPVKDDYRPTQLAEVRLPRPAPALGPTAALGSTPASAQGFSSAPGKNYHRRPLRKQQPLIEVNKADTSGFISLPFIGNKLAARIVLFRQKLGGFYCKEQVGEVYGIVDSVYRIIAKRLTCDSTVIAKLNINTADDSVLKQHPYIRWKYANALINFRQQHGKFRSLDDLEKVRAIDGEALHKMMPYLTVN